MIQETYFRPGSKYLTSESVAFSERHRQEGWLHLNSGLKDCPNGSTHRQKQQSNRDSAQLSVCNILQLEDLLKHEHKCQQTTATGGVRVFTQSGDKSDKMRRDRGPEL